MSALFRTSQGATIRLGQELGRGGEGVVYLADGRTDLAVKIYHPNLAPERQEKIRRMVEAQWHKTSSFVAFPVDILFDERGNFSGFSMRRVGAHHPVHALYSPSSRKTEFPGANFHFLIRAASNISRAVASAHATGCVVGDINHSGVLVSDKATVILIDSDSFQVLAKSNIFHCKVGVPEFTPPELQGKDFSTTARVTNHDAFGLAVLIFQLLFMGRHPYAGRSMKRGDDPPLEKVIQTFRFAYSRQQQQTRMEPPPGVPTLADVPGDVANAFEQAFGQGGTIKRPTATQWVALLDSMERSLTTCRANLAHHFHRGLAACPWCRMEAVFPGIVLFGLPGRKPIAITAVDVKSLMAAIQAIADPGQALSLSNIVVPAKNLAPSTRALQVQEGRWRRIWQTSVLGGIGAVLAFTTSGALLLVGVGIAAAAGTLAARTPVDLSALRTARRTAEATWENMNRSWQRNTGNDNFLSARQEAVNSLKSLAAVPDEEDRLMQELERKRREAQLEQFLERFRIDRATIRLVGTGRKLQLASYGIETAADVLKGRLRTLRGFGPAIIGELEAWRSSIERRFVFNPRQPLDPREVAAVKAKIAHEQANRLTKTRKAIQHLDEVARDIKTHRMSMRTAAQAAHHAVKQAELDLQAAEAATIDGKKRFYLIAYAICVLAAIYVINNIPRGFPDLLSRIPSEFLRPNSGGPSDAISRPASGPSLKSDQTKKGESDFSIEKVPTITLPPPATIPVPRPKWAPVELPSAIGPQTPRVGIPSPPQPRQSDRDEAAQNPLASREAAPKTEPPPPTVPLPDLGRPPAEIPNNRIPNEVVIPLPAPMEIKPVPLPPTITEKESPSPAPSRTAPPVQRQKNPWSGR